MRILGIDPGSRATGWGLVAFEAGRSARLAGGVIRPPQGALAHRLATLFRELSGLIDEAQPDAAALETVFSSRNARAALLLGHARGVALLACGMAGLAPAEYAPVQVKSAVVGYGGASKHQVQHMVQQLLALPRTPPSDEADALAVAICHAHTARRPVLGAPP